MARSLRTILRRGGGHLGPCVALAVALAACGGSSLPPPPSFPITAQPGVAVDEAVLLPWMAYHGIPGLSVAVLGADGIEWAHGYGVAAVDGAAPVTPATLFQAASISKTVAALTALRTLDARALDADVATLLRSWTLPAHAAGAPVTPRLLLRHSAGVSVWGFAGYEAGATLPTLAQILDGAAPANNAPIRVEAEPGVFRYSGGGYEVVQQVLEDVTGEAFATLAQRQVFDPLGMSRSSYREPLAPADAAAGHLADGSVLRGRWMRYPELAAASVWTTPSDLARLLVGLRRAYHAAPDAALPPDLARAMIAPLAPTGWGDPYQQYVGLGVFLNGSASAPAFGHGGGNLGYRAFMWAHLADDFGVVVMTNSENGSRIFEALIGALEAAYRTSSAGAQAVVALGRLKPSLTPRSGP